MELLKHRRHHHAHLFEEFFRLVRHVGFICHDSRMGTMLGLRAEEQLLVVADPSNLMFGNREQQVRHSATCRCTSA